jgi:hypothetical protein
MLYSNLATCRRTTPRIDAYITYVKQLLACPATSAGEDLVFMLPRDVSAFDNSWQQLLVLLRSSLKASSFTPPRAH